MSEKKSILKERSFFFAIECINTYKKLTELNKEFVLSKQLLRSGTSIGANIREAQNAESKMDFIHQLGISQKKCDENLYWLELLYVTKFISDETYYKIYSSGKELLRMIKSSILSSKLSLNKVNNS
jgi:four helix bundle protein